MINPLIGAPCCNSGATGSSFYGNYNATMWWTHINGSSYSGKISKQLGAHYLKTGFDYRRLGGGTTTGGVSSFFFDAALTADTFNSPNTKLVGHEFATMLLGALNSNSMMITAPIKYVDTDVIAGYIQDDWKLSRRISLNLGLRYEYEIPFHSENNGMTRYLDLTKPIPEMQATPPKMPAEALALMKEPYVYNGAWQFADNQHRYTWNPQKNVFLPRVGAAIRIDDKTALRIGYARYATPSDYINMTTPSGAVRPNLLNPPYPGFDATQTSRMSI